MEKNFRSPKIQEQCEAYYREPHEGCFICKREAVRQFRHWKIIRNMFPYDMISSEHDMLVPVRHIGRESELSDDEKTELIEIKERYLPGLDYDFIQENLPRAKSAPGHYHLHLLKFR